MQSFQMTYATLYDPPQALHTSYEAALQALRPNLGQTYGMLIGGEEVTAPDSYPVTNPANPEQVLGLFQLGTREHADQAVQSARRAFPDWSGRPWQERVALLRKAADRIEERLFEMAAATSLEVGKNRLEALGDVSEAPALIRYACDRLEQNEGFTQTLANDPLPGYQVENRSTLRPYGVWLVISPFNFPTALTAGPAAAALAAGNTVVAKPAARTSWSVRLLIESFLEAGLPPGTLNLVTGSGSELGQVLVEHPGVDGVTFTGSYPVGMSIYRQFAQRDYIHPVILELGGKNPAVVSRQANLELAASGITRSAFGLQGQKCSANSRVFIEAPVYDELLERIVAGTKQLTIGDPTQRETYLGPVISRGPFQDYQDAAWELASAGKIAAGGRAVADQFGGGYFVEPTIAVDLPLEHHLWKEELFLPITLIHKVASLDEGLALANDTSYGLTSGFYGTEEEAERFFRASQAGVNYVNRPQGSTTGAWPGYQPFGGWKASGSSGVGAGGPHYLQRYMREQIQTVVR